MNTVGRFIVGSTLAVTTIFFSGAVLAAGSVTIMSPKDGGELASGSGNKLEYNVELSPNGNHLHVYVDGGNPMIVRSVSGCPCSINLPDLSSGKHEIVIKEATASHAMTGVETSTAFTVK